MIIHKSDNLVAKGSKNSEKMPVLFAGHGSPMNVIENNEFTKGWSLIAKLFPKPEAILCISAHWETKGTFVTEMENPKTIHDFGGFPKELYEVIYPAPGNPELADEIIEIVQKVKIETTEDWGLDHGCWSVLKRMYPEADVPVVQLGLDYNLSPMQHYELSKDLSPLRKKGVLILGSGNMVHNLGMINWGTSNEGFEWAEKANDIFKKLITDNEHEKLINYESLGKEAQLAIPTNEHFLPLLYVLALKEENEKVTFFNDKCVYGSLSMTSVFIN